jgi:hypothetical protein
MCKDVLFDGTYEYRVGDWITVVRDRMYESSPWDWVTTGKSYQIDRISANAGWIWFIANAGRLVTCLPIDTDGRRWLMPTEEYLIEQEYVAPICSHAAPQAVITKFDWKVGDWAECTVKNDVSYTYGKLYQVLEVSQGVGYAKKIHLQSNQGNILDMYDCDGGWFKPAPPPPNQPGISTPISDSFCISAEQIGADLLRKRVRDW